MDIFKAFAPISKVDDEKRMVYGYASTDTKDSQGDVVKLDAIEEALPDYMRFGNIREMHSMSAVGVAKSAEVDDRGLYIGAKVVDDAAWAKVKEGVYKGFSIGGKALEKAGGIISKLRLTEISLVDRPANPECVIDTWKAETLDAPADVAPAEATPEVAKATVADIAKAASYEDGKPIFDARSAMNAMETVFFLLMSEANEATQEPEQLAMLQGVIAGLKSFIVAELSERYEPEAVAMAESNVDILKAGARYSKSTKEALAKVHGMLRDAEKAMTEMGYADAEEDDEAEKAESADDLRKIDEEMNDAFAKAGALPGDNKIEFIAKLASERDDLVKRVADLEAQPEPAKAATTAIEKAEDVKDGLASPVASPDPNNPLSMFKAALSRPIVIGG